MTLRASPSVRWKAPRASTWRWIAALQFALIATSALAFALALTPEPHSDWLYYWDAARDIHRYQRGGAGLAVLALLRWFELSPVAASLVLNVPSAATLLWVAYAADRSAWKLPAQFVAAYLWMISPFYGIVQLDLVATAMLAMACWFLLIQQPCRVMSVRVLLALILGCAAVSTKPQLALVLWSMILVLSAVRLLSRWQWPRRMDLFIGVMLVASLMGFAVDYMLRKAVDQGESMRTSSAVTLYGGFLVSTTGPGCGYWSVAAAEAAKADLHKPIHTAIYKRLSRRPVSHWFGVLACKAPQIGLPPPYALYWALESPSVREAISRSSDRGHWERLYRHARMFESVVYRGLGLLIVVAVWAAAWKMRRDAPEWALLAPSWILSFWAVHAVFEIQGRYFLPMFLLAPILLALALLHAKPELKLPARPARARQRGWSDGESMRDQMLFYRLKSALCGRSA
jgi:hypothetical protein